MQTKFLLGENQIPTHWYNIIPDLPGPLSPVLHPGTGKPVTPDDLLPLFPMGIIEQEVSTERWIPIPDPVLEKRRTRMILVGDVPSPVNPPSGCRFNPRCPYAEDNCRTDEPPLAEVRTGHFVACHYWNEVEDGTKRVTNNTEIVREGDLPAIPSAASGASLN